MATTFVDYTGDGNATKSFSFPSIKEADIKVEVDNVIKTSGNHYNITSYTTTGGGNVVFTSGNIPASPAAIRIYRDTDVDAAKATFVAGSSVKAGDLNNNMTQVLYSAQEEQNQTVITSGIKDGAVTTAKIKDLNVTTAKIANDAVTADKIPDDAINSEHYAAASIDTEHIANANITTAKLANDAVTAAKLADDAVVTANITDANVTTAKIAADAIDGTKIANDSINSEHYVDGSIDTAHIADSQVTTAKIADSNVTTAKIANDAVTADKIADAVIVTAGEQAAASANDTTFFTTSASDARYFNVSTGDTIKDGDTFPDNDTTIATTAAINDRIIDLVDDVGGFVPIANETSFPTANPDVNNGAGTLVSVKAIGSTRTPSSGTVTIANGAGSGNTVTITGCGSTVLTAGFGVIVETTTTLHTYAFHRLVPKATEVTTVAGISGNVTTVAGISANTTTVAGISANVTTVAGIASNVTSVAGNASNINSAVSNASNINSAVSNASNINTVAGSISNVNTAATNIASINNASSNISSVNNFGDTYQVASSNPSTDGGGNALAEGDLYFNTSANELKVYNGSSWQGGVTASGNFAATTGNTFTGDNKYNDGVKLLVGSGSDLEIFHHVTDGSFINDAGTSTLKLQTGGSTKLEIQSGGVGVTGNIVVSGNVDGRDVAADGTKLDGIESSATADQTAAEIRTLVESASDSNVFTDADHTKLNAIEASATADQTDAEIRAAVEAASDSNVFTDADHTKLNGVATSATANPNALDNVVEDTSPQLGGDLDTNGNHILLDDSRQIKFGDDNDMQIYHTGGHGYLENGTGHMYVRGNGGQIILKPNSSENSVRCMPDGAVELYYDNTKKFETTSGGVKVTGDIDAQEDIYFRDTKKIYVGDGNDLQIYHDGSDSYIVDSGTGDLMIRCSDDLKLQNADGSESFLHCNDGGDVILYRAGTERLRTTSTGVTVTGDLFLDNPSTAGRDIQFDVSDNALKISDNVNINFGTGNDLQIYHDGSHSYVKDTGTGELRLVGNIVKINNAANNETMAVFTEDGSVDLYYNDSKKFETSSAGIKLSGTAHSDLSTLSDGSTITVDFPTATHFTVTLGGNRTFGDPDNTGSAIGSSGSIFIVQDGSGSRTASFHGDYKFAGGTAPTLSTAANAVDRLDYVIRAANDVHCVVTLDVK